MPKPTEPPAIVRISTNCILGGKFFNRGEALPVASAEDLPDNLKPLVVTGEPEADQEPHGPRGSFELNTIYQMTSDGRLGRRVQRQAAQMEADAQEDAWLEEQAANAELPPEIAEGLEDEHRRHVDLQKAQSAADAARSEAVSDAAAAAAEPPTLFVRRGSRHYIEIHRTKLKPDEPVFTKDPADGAYQVIGTTDARAEPPDIPISL